MIRQVTLVTTQGTKTYRVGDNVNGRIVNAINVVSLYFTGDPYDHYAGYDKDGEMLFSVNCLCPCEVEYLLKGTHVDAF